MRLETCKGILRGSLFLAIGYIDSSDYSIGTQEKCAKVVREYLNDNGLKFDFTTKKNKRVVKHIVDVAEDHIFNKIGRGQLLNQSEKESLELLSKKLKIDITFNPICCNW